MNEKLIIYLSTLGVLVGAFCLCIPFPSLVGALTPFGLSVSGLFLTYMGGNAAHGFVSNMASTNPPPNVNADWRKDKS